MANKTMLKFRIWNNSSKEFISSYKQAEKYYHGFCNDNEDYRNLGLSFWEEADGYFRILKFTGLFDNHIREIYEGDIVQWSDSGGIRIAVVEFEKGEVIFKCKTNREIGKETKKFERDFSIGNFMYSDTEKYLMIIGNIFENQELLNCEEGRHGIPPKHLGILPNFI